MKAFLISTALSSGTVDDEPAEAHTLLLLNSLVIESIPMYLTHIVQDTSSNKVQYITSSYVQLFQQTAPSSFQAAIAMLHHKSSST